MFTGMPYALRGKKEIEVIKASTEVAGFVRACCLCSWMQPATRDLTAGKLGLDKAKFLVREESRLGHRLSSSGLAFLAVVLGPGGPAAMQSGRAGSPVKRSCPGAGGRLDIWNR